MIQSARSGGFNDRRAASPAPAKANAEAGGRWHEDKGRRRNRHLTRRST
jgi:hypothetical protein